MSNTGEVKLTPQWRAFGASSALLQPRRAEGNVRSDRRSRGSRGSGTKRQHGPYSSTPQPPANSSGSVPINSSSSSELEASSISVSTAVALDQIPKSTVAIKNAAVDTSTDRDNQQLVAGLKEESQKRVSPPKERVTRSRSSEKLSPKQGIRSSEDPFPHLTSTKPVVVPNQWKRTVNEYGFEEDKRSFTAAQVVTNALSSTDPSRQALTPATSVSGENRREIRSLAPPLPQVSRKSQSEKSKTKSFSSFSSGSLAVGQQSKRASSDGNLSLTKTVSLRSDTSPSLLLSGKRSMSTEHVNSSSIAASRSVSSSSVQRQKPLLHSASLESKHGQGLLTKSRADFLSGLRKLQQKDSNAAFSAFTSPPSPPWSASSSSNSLPSHSTPSSPPDSDRSAIACEFPSVTVDEETEDLLEGLSAAPIGGKSKIELGGPLTFEELAFSDHDEQRFLQNLGWKEEESNNFDQWITQEEIELTKQKLNETKKGSSSSSSLDSLLAKAALPSLPFPKGLNLPRPVDSNWDLKFQAEDDSFLDEDEL